MSKEYEGKGIFSRLIKCKREDPPSVKFRILCVNEFLKSSVPSVSIIGSSGRHGEFKDGQLFPKIVAKAYKIITEEFKLTEFRLVSGGAAWCDHAAVVLFLEGKSDQLHLHTPALFKGASKGFDTTSQAGKTTNRLHRSFSQQTGRDSFADIEAAFRKRGCKCTYYEDGFLARNKVVAQSDYLIAFSWSKGNEPEEGGTKDTWKKCTNGKKVHVSLQSLMELCR